MSFKKDVWLPVLVTKVPQNVSSVWILIPCLQPTIWGKRVPHERVSVTKYKAWKHWSGWVEYLKHRLQNYKLYNMHWPADGLKVILHKVILHITSRDSTTHIECIRHFNLFLKCQFNISMLSKGITKYRTQ